MKFNLEWKENAIQNLSKLERFVARRIYSKVGELRNGFESRDVRRLKDSGFFRLRVGDYRVIFEIEKESIIILKVGHRKNIYKK